MDRSRSPPSRGSEPRNGSSTNLPPWERRTIAQVPFVDASSPALSDAERKALPDLWATHSSALQRLPPKLSPDSKASTSDEGSFPAARDQYVNHSSRDRAPWTSVPLQVSAPYETQYYIPPAPKTAPPLARQLGPRAPLTPPDSLSNSSTFSSAAASPGQVYPAQTALPGTMSSRTREDSRSRTKPSDRGRSGSKHSKADSVTFGTRFKSAFKDIFKRNPVDESQFERIEDRHWTDEY